MCHRALRPAARRHFALPLYRQQKLQTITHKFTHALSQASFMLFWARPFQTNLHTAVATTPCISHPCLGAHSDRFSSAAPDKSSHLASARASSTAAAASQASSPLLWRNRRPPPPPSSRSPASPLQSICDIYLTIRPIVRSTSRHDLCHQLVVSRLPEVPAIRLRGFSYS